MASGDELSNDGEFVVDDYTVNDVKSSATFRIAKVGMPIFTISLYTIDDYDVIFRKDGGTVFNTITNETYEFIKAAGVYFFKLKVPRAIVKPDSVLVRPGA